MEERQRNKVHVCGYEYLRVPCGGRWQDVMKHERVRWVGEGCRANGCGVGEVTCGWRGGTLLQWGQMPHWLDFISHRQTPRNVPTSSVWACESVWTSQPVNLHQTRCAVTLSWWVPPSLAFFHCFSLFRNLCSRAHSHCSKRKKSCEKARERELERDCEMKERAAWHLARVCIIGCGWCDQKRLQKYNTLTNHLSASSSYSCLSLAASRVGHPAVIIAAGTLRDFSVHFSLWIISILVIHHLGSCNQMFYMKSGPLSNLFWPKICPRLVELNCHLAL